MLLSIIIPAFNAEKYVANSIKNIFKQRINNDSFEVIIVNDGSVDKTKEMVLKLQKEHSNVVLLNQENKGSSVARNNGIKLAKGEYIFFFDCDDYLADDTLPVILKVAKKFKPNIVAFDAIRTNNFNLNISQKNKIDFEKIEVIKGQYFLEKNPEHRLEVWWYILNREFLLKTGLSFKEGVFHQDVIFTLSLFIEANKVIKLPIDVYRYYQSEGSSIRNKKSSHLKKIIDDYITLFNDIEDFLSRFKIKYPELKNSIVYNINKRKHRDAFFMINRMIRAKFKTKCFNAYLEKLKKTDSYPISYAAIDNQTNKLKYTILVFIVNNRLMVNLVLITYRFFK